MGPTSICSPLSPPADAIVTIARLALAVTGAIFVFRDAATRWSATS
jgi:hypothetical protein